MVFCFSCGARLEAELECAGSLRCHDCRDTVAPLQPRLVEAVTAQRPVLTLIRTLPRAVEPSEPPPFAA
jgi:hypothetical protein